MSGSISVQLHSKEYSSAANTNLLVRLLFPVHLLQILRLQSVFGALQIGKPFLVLGQNVVFLDAFESELEISNRVNDYNSSEAKSFPMYW